MKKIIILILSAFLCRNQISAYELVMAAMFKDEAAYLKEWILYHKMVGVEHFWLYNNNSADNWEEVLTPFIDEGLVDVIPWNSTAFASQKPQAFPFDLQLYMMQDALKKAKQETKWIAILDIDEFLMPRKEATVTQCLNNHFSEASAVFVNWLNFGTGDVHISSGDPILCHLTRSSMRSYQKNGNGKSIWRAQEVLEDQARWIHWAPLRPGATYVNGDSNPIILEGEGANWDWQMHDKHIRIHHYFLRDENFFANRRLKLAQNGQGAYSQETLWEFHELLSRRKDMSMIEFIKNYHPDEYERIWKN